jgi:tRNA A37 threonylcarbamoyladenosine dehydratase
LVSGTNITILGAGGIGSFLCQWLARQWPNEINIYDHDIFEMNNAGSQFMTTKDIDRNKAEVAVDHAIAFSNYMDVYDMGKYEPDVREPAENYLNQYVFSCFDNMKYRKMAFDNWVKNKDSLLFIDGRI